VDYQPEIIVLSPCGFDLKGVKAESHVLASYEGWDKIPAYKNSRIYAVNASAYFSRPGPRIVDGLELLAHIIHPEIFPEKPPDNGMERLDPAFIKA
jgi:iron complex transport system substrate-binding protein